MIAEYFIILCLVVFLFGPKELPTLARQAAKVYRYSLNIRQVMLSHWALYLNQIEAEKVDQHYKNQ
jgi:hypothetical protein